MNSDNGDTTTPRQNNYTLTLLNNTFYNVAAAVHTVAPNWNGNGLSPFFQTTECVERLSNVEWIAMNNIFDGSTTARRCSSSMGSSTTRCLSTTCSLTTRPTLSTTRGRRSATAAPPGSIFGNPDFRNAAAGDFRLHAGLGGHRCGPQRDRPLSSSATNPADRDPEP